MIQHDAQPMLDMPWAQIESDSSRQFRTTPKDADGYFGELDCESPALDDAGEDALRNAQWRNFRMRK